MHGTAKTYDAIIVGGGVIGMSIAYHLAHQKVDTLLLDRNDPARATNAGAGILSPETSGSDSEVWVNFAIKAGNYYPKLIEHLKEQQATSPGYERCGILTVAIDDSEIEQFDRTKDIIFQRKRQKGQPSDKDLHLISSHQAKSLFPCLAPVQKAIYYKRAARVDGRLLTQALQHASKAQGLEILEANVEKLLFQKGQVVGVITKAGAFHANKVVIAGGAWSQAYEDELGVRIPVEPQRGQIMHFSMKGVDTDNWPMVSAFHGHYIVPWPQGNIVVGATRETNSGFDTQPTASGIHEVLHEALRVAPGLAQAELKSVRVGLRPMTNDQLPILSKVPCIDNLYLATGHGSTGLLLGPYSGKMMSQMMLDQYIETDITPFSVERFM
jgi:D-amino-acid dehydrogenase